MPDGLKSEPILKRRPREASERVRMGKGKRGGRGEGGEEVEKKFGGGGQSVARQQEKRGRVCLIGFAGWKDRDPERSTLLSHSITATGHIMRGRTISSPQTHPSSHTHTRACSAGSNQTHTLPSSRLFLSASCALAHVCTCALVEIFWGLPGFRQ